MHGNRESPESLVSDGPASRIGKPKGASR
jgi:hypothetical protein